TLSTNDLKPIISRRLIFTGASILSGPFPVGNHPKFCNRIGLHDAGQSEKPLRSGGQTGPVAPGTLPAGSFRAAT
ncbi:MAG TPA: hypothetical protein VIU40_15370, partial [Geobacteraceae bacterium]